MTETRSEDGESQPLWTPISSGCDLQEDELGLSNNKEVAGPSLSNAGPSETNPATVTRNQTNVEQTAQPLPTNIDPAPPRSQIINLPLINQAT